jgi:ribosome modulation factor
MAELNKKQRAGMDLIAGLEQPTAAELECLTILAKVNDLPEEMQEQLDEHLSMQHDLDDTADKLKELKEDVKSKWSAIRGLARNWGQDMFHQGNPPPPPPKLDDDVVVTAEFKGLTDTPIGQAMKKVADQINAGALDGKKAKRGAQVEQSSEGDEQDPVLVDAEGNPLKGLERAAQQGRVAFVEGKGLEDNPYVQGGHKKSWGAGWNDSLAARDDGWSAFHEEGFDAENPWKQEGFEWPLHRAWEIGRAAAKEEGETQAVSAPKKAKRAKVKTSSENYPALEIFAEGARAFNAGKTLNDDPYVPFEGMSPQWASQHPISSGFWQKGFKKAMKAWEQGQETARRADQFEGETANPYGNGLEDDPFARAWKDGWNNVRGEAK